MKPILFVVAAVAVIVVAGVIFYATTPSAVAPEPSLTVLPAQVSPLARKVPSSPQQPSQPSVYTGTVLAGNSAPLLDFTREDFEQAKGSDELVVLYFYANWCPICAKEFPLMQAAFNQLSTDKVIGFRVNFNDSDTEEYEEQLASEYGVAYQHTKVFLRGGQRMLKSPESWTMERYITEITNVLH